MMMAVYFFVESAKARAYDEFGTAFAVLKDEFISKIRTIDVSEIFEDDTEDFLRRCQYDLEIPVSFEGNKHTGTSYLDSFSWRVNNGFPDFDSVVSFFAENPQYEIRDWNMMPVSLEEFKGISEQKEGRVE